VSFSLGDAKKVGIDARADENNQAKELLVVSFNNDVMEVYTTISERRIIAKILIIATLTSSLCNP
jgi:hypothetical protein